MHGYPKCTVYMKVLLDTSLLVSFFLIDKYQKKAKAIFEKIMKGGIEGIISCLSYVELCGVLRRNTDKETANQVKNKVNELIESGLIKITPFKISDTYEAGEFAIMTGLKGADLIIVQAAIKNKAKLCTFDEEIIRKAKGIVEFF